MLIQQRAYYCSRASLRATWPHLQRKLPAWCGTVQLIEQLINHRLPVFLLNQSVFFYPIILLRGLFSSVGEFTEGGSKVALRLAQLQ